MPTSNPALSEKIFEREIQNSRGGGQVHHFGGSPADELPPGLFGGQRSAGSSTLPPPPAFPPPGQTYPPGPTAGDPYVVDQRNTMRLGGVLSASAVLLVILAITGGFGWSAVKVISHTNEVTGKKVVDSLTVPPWLIGAWIGGLVLALVTIFKPKFARVTAPLYAAAEGLLVGGISKIFNVQYDGIVLQAVGLTGGVFLVMLFLYATRIIKVTEKLRMAIVASTFAVMLVYLASMLVNVFGGDVGFIHDAGPVGIIFSLVVVGIASFNLLLDFDFVERGVKAGAPRYMEWYAAFGLMVTLIWLYLELLRLLAKLRER